MSDPLGWDSGRKGKRKGEGKKGGSSSDPTNDSQMRTSRRSKARRPRHLFVLSAKIS